MDPSRTPANRAQTGRVAGVSAIDLAEFDLLDGAPAAELRRLASLLGPLAANPGEVLMGEGDLAKSFVLLAPERSKYVATTVA